MALSSDIRRSSFKRGSAMDTHLKVATSAMNPHNGGGLIVIGETVATLHKEIPGSKVWDTVGYGIPCLNLNENILIISLSCLKNGETLYEFSISGHDKYKVLDSHFHVFMTERSRFTDSSNTAVANAQLTTNRYSHHAELSYGLSFAHEKVAERFYKAVIQLFPRKLNSSHAIDRLTHSLSAITLPEETTDLASHTLVKSDSFVEQSYNQIEEAGALTSSGKFIPNPIEENSSTDEDSLKVLHQSVSQSLHGAALEEDVDLVSSDNKLRGPSFGCSSGAPRTRRSTSMFSVLSSRRGSLDNSSETLLNNKHAPLIKQRSESMDDVRISYPTTVRHLAHVSQETPFYTLKQVINTGYAPYSVLNSDIEKQRLEKLKRTPSAPAHKSSFVRSSSSIPLLVSPANSSLYKKQFPCPPPQVNDFDALVQKLQTNGEIDRYSDLTSSTQAWQQSFYCAVSNLIRKKIFDDDTNSKLLSFTQSGREETTERPDSRATSLIIHDHGIVCL